MKTRLSIRDFWRTRQPTCVYTYVPEPIYRQKPPEEMVRLAVDIIGNWEATGANCPPVFIPDFGTVTLAKPWGGQVVTTSDGQIFIEPVSDNIDAVLDIAPGPNPDVELAVQLYREIVRQTGRQDIRFVAPDFQGSLGTAVQIMEQAAFLMAMHTEPEKVHRLLDLVTTRNIQFMKDVQARLHVDGGAWPYIWLPQEVGIVVTEDLMPLLSPATYREFGLPCLRRLSGEFGGLFLHSCGQWTHQAPVLAESGLPLLGIDFCYPYAKLEQIQVTLPGLVLQPGFEFFKTSEHADFPAFIDAMIRERRGDTVLWPAMNSNPLWKFDEVRRVLDRHGIGFDGFTC